MRVQSVGTVPTPPVPAPKTPFDPGVENYHGPSDGLSRPWRFPRVTGPVLSAATALFCRVEREGFENLPRSGAHVYSPNHVSALDVPIALNLGVEDMRTMANIDVFQFPLPGRLMTWAGAYPVNKVKPSPVTKQHTVNLVKSGKGLCIFPEGDFTEEGERGRVGPFKKGAAAAAILGEAESVVPIAIHYQPNDRPRHGERLAGVLVAGAVITAGIVGMSHPGLGAVVSTLGGTLTGAFLGGALGRSLVEDKEAWNPGPKFVAGLKGGALGATAGALAGWAGGQHPALLLGCSLAGGLAALGLSEAWRDRTVARVKVGSPIPVGPYVKQAQTDRKTAVMELTEELHERIGRLKEQLSGVPYDPDAPRVTVARPTQHWTAGMTGEEMRAGMTAPD